MSVSDIFERLDRLDIRLWVDGGALKFRAPEGRMTAEVRRLIQRNKPAIMARLRALPEQKARRYPLSYNQRSLWVLYQMAPESSCYNVSLSCRIVSPVDPEAMRRVCRQLIARHEILRTTYGFDGGDGQTLQTVHPEMEPDFHLVDAAGLSEEALKGRVQAYHSRPFDLVGGPLLRLCLFKRPSGDHLFVMTIHHIACDGSSFKILIEEFGRLYRAEVTGDEAGLPGVRRQYRDFVRFQKEMLLGDEGARLAAFWRKRLASPLPEITLPLDHERPATQRFAGTSYPFHLTGPSYAAIRDFTKAENVTLYVLLLAVFKITLMHCCNQEEIIVGTPAVGRSRPEYKGGCGHFINMVAMRGELSGALTFREHLQRCRRVVLEALDHQAYPFPLLVETLALARDPDRSPLFQVMFNMLNRKVLGAAADFFMGAAHDTPVDFGGVQIMPYPVDQEEGQFELVLEIIDTEESLACAFKYRTDLFNEETVAAMAEAFQGGLHQFMEDPDMRLGDVPLPEGLGRESAGVERHERGAVPTPSGPLPTGPGVVSGAPVAFMFTGQGAQHVQMARGLYQGEPAFAACVNECSERLAPLLGCDIRNFLYPAEEEAAKATEKLGQTAITQPVLFTLEYALAQLWTSWGVRPQAMIGHSIGEYAAACLAGVFSLEDALALVAARGRLMQMQPKGAMLAVNLSEEEIAPFLRRGLSVAVINAPSRCVVSGPEPSVQALEARLAKAFKGMTGMKKKVRWTRLRTSHAFHSEMMDPAVEPFAACVAKARPLAPQIPIVSNLTGTWMTDEEATDPAYWAAHLRQTVRFAKGVETLLGQPGRVLLEVGPGNTLGALVRQQASPSHGPVILTSLPHPGQSRADDEFIADTVASLQEAGVTVDRSRESGRGPQAPCRPDEEKADPDRAKGYWEEKLKGELPVLQLPMDRPRSVDGAYRGGTHFFGFSQEQTAALKERSGKAKGTEADLLLSAYAVLLARYAGQETLMVGVAGDSVFPLRVEVPDSGPFDALVRSIHGATREARRHQGVSLRQLVQSLAPGQASGAHPLFQVMFAFQDGPITGASGFEALCRPLGEGPGCDLCLSVWEEAGRWQGAFLFNEALFESATVERMHESFIALTDAVAKGGDGPVHRLPLLSRAERDKLVWGWNDTVRRYPSHVCLHELFEAQVDKTPDAVAVAFEEKTLSYRELSQRANRLAHYLRKKGVGPEIRVGVFMERSMEMIVALYGILKAGGAYVPLDPEYPAERIAYMLEDTEVPVLLTQARLKAEVKAHAAAVICLDTQWETVARESAESPVTGVSADNLAYVIYTSGSTGKPKGVMNSHRGICNRLYWMQEEYRLTASDRILQKTPYSFDVSVWEFFWPLLFGARLVVAPPGIHKDPASLGALIAETGITILHFVPSMLQLFLREDHGTRCRSLTKVMCSGEALSCELRDRFFEKMDAELHNLYGPTEAAVDVTFWQCRPGGPRLTVPIGRPVANTQIYILDGQMEPVPVGVAGELHIGGVQVARGYLNRPDLTREKFVPDPFQDEPGACLYKTGDLARYLPDGQVEYLGRNDFQVKIRGLRIELGEIEAVICGHPDVSEAVVVAREDVPGNKQVVAYVVGSGGVSGLAGGLRGFLEKKLPDFMIPSFFIQLPALPLLANGKVNRKALPAPTTDRPEVCTPYAAPASEIETAILEVWKALLGVEEIGVEDNFFEVGGDSLLLVEVAHQLAEKLKADLKVHHLFEYPTIRAVAGFLDPAPAPAPARGDLDARLQKRKGTLSRRKKNRTGDFS